MSSAPGSYLLSYHDVPGPENMDYGDFSSQAGFANPADHYGLHHPHATTMLDDMHKSNYYNPTLNAALSCDIKPRLTKEQHDILEAHFQEQNKPNTNTKKGFAESLGVSLEKVNNWFQNRRAKSKQDAKKQEGAINLFQQQHQQQPDGSVHAHWDSSTEVSPAFSSSEYMSMMQQCGPNDLNSDRLSRSIAIPRPQQVRPDGPYDNMSTATVSDPYAAYGVPQMPQHLYDSPQDFQRRTLTQEQFDAIAQNGDLAQAYHNYDLFQPALSNDGFMQNESLEQPSALNLPRTRTGINPNLDASDFSNPSEHSFPSMANSQERASMSASVSEWTDSRSSSVNSMQAETFPIQIKEQWQPGQSVEVDFEALNEHFQQVAQARLSTVEQPLAFPDDEAFTRQGSQAASLVQNMSHIGMDTPQPQPNEVFKTPAPPSSIAARRQRPRPAALGLAAMRSQSYSGASQPHSPSHVSQANAASGQSLRRIRSSNVVGGVSQGRVQKVPGSAQRSPLSWTFAESLNSPKAIRHASQTAGGTLAPPTPMSPQFPQSDTVQPVSQWQASMPGQVNRQPSISEHENEFDAGNSQQMSTLPAQKFCSPPHTPMYYQQQFVQQHMANNFHLENTPPQSAPALQQCFSINYPTPSISLQPQTGFQHQNMMYTVDQGPRLVNALSLEQHMPMSTNTLVPIPPYAAPVSAVPAEVSMQYPYGVPVMSASGQMQMTFPSQLQLLQQTQVSQMISPSQPCFPQYTATCSPQKVPSTKPPVPEFEVHEYTPSEALKRDAGPHKAVDTGPKNYTFANQGPEHFDKAKQSGDSKTSSTTEE